MTTNESTEKPKRRTTPWHDRFGTLFKLFDMPRVSTEARFDAAKEMPVGDVKMVLKDGKQWTEAERQYLPDGVRDSVAHHKLLEFKYTESFNKDALEQTIGYNIIYRRSYDLSAIEVASFLLVSRTPRASTLRKFGYQPTAHSGVYRTDMIFAEEVTLIVLNQLSDAPHNAYIKLFASKEAVKRRAIAQLKEMGVFTAFTQLSEFLFALARLLFQEEKMNLIENDHLLPEELIEAGKELAKAYLAQLPPEQRMAGLSPELRMVGLRPNQRLAGLAPKEVLSQYRAEEVLTQYEPEQRLAGLSLEEIERYMRRLKEKQSASTHETLSDIGSASSSS